ncbi:hypothetical protein PIB30_014286 [Stylosanthes scabra]|uniref:Uncharacterized protein n=1 Tax=Stylosanthes scabra TaxID=79078 RepID=A0ABU6VA08_9FABA|nr:hypothetical protein [Stylosanthes scabra]
MRPSPSNSTRNALLLRTTLDLSFLLRSTSTHIRAYLPRSTESIPFRPKESVLASSLELSALFVCLLVFVCEASLCPGVFEVRFMFTPFGWTISLVLVESKVQAIYPPGGLGPASSEKFGSKEVYSLGLYLDSLPPGIPLSSLLEHTEAKVAAVFVFE